MLVLDTNVLIYAVNAAAPEHQACRAELEARMSASMSWFLTWGIVYEFLRAVTHRVFPARKPFEEAWALIDTVLRSPGCTLLVETDRHRDVLAHVVAEVPGVSSNQMHDAHIATLMREHGIRQIVTRDVGFHRFPWIEVVDPLA